MFIAVPTFYSLKSDQTGLLEDLPADKDVLAILPTDFGKSVIYQVFCFAKINSACVLVISSLNRVLVERVSDLNELGLPAVQLSEKDEDSMNAIAPLVFLPNHTNSSRFQQEQPRSEPQLHYEHSPKIIKSQIVNECG